MPVNNRDRMSKSDIGDRGGKSIDFLQILAIAAATVFSLCLALCGYLLFVLWSSMGK